ncbi:MAG: GNAT family N-acetyltransferase [Clostridia bacterium]|nr:GNAT family N-acetyltransferase [Clostridia bacterium]
MNLPPETLQLKNGKTCILRSAQAEDAARMIAYMKRMLNETPYLLRTSEEFDYTVEAEAEVLARKRDDPRALMILAETGGEIIAVSDVTPLSNKSRTLHRAVLGMSVRRDYWQMGIGSAMMERLIAHAEDAGFEQIELEVVASNRRAIGLYTKYGFQVYGTRPHGLKYADGTYADDYLMRREL